MLQKLWGCDQHLNKQLHLCLVLLNYIPWIFLGGVEEIVNSFDVFHDLRSNYAIFWQLSLRSSLFYMHFKNTHSNEPDTIKFCRLVILCCWPSPWYLNLFLQRVFSALQEPVVCPSYWNRKHDWVKTFWSFSLASYAFFLFDYIWFYSDASRQ